MSSMKAAVVTGFGKPLQIQELPIPEPGPGQILVKIEASGVCHTDLHAAEGDWPVKPKPPFIPGHEGAGVVVAIGGGTTYTGNVSAHVDIISLALKYRLDDPAPAPTSTLPHK